MVKINLKAEPRKVLGRKVKKLRLEGVLPANVYGKNIKSQSITVNLKDFLKVYHEAGETNLIDLTLGKEDKVRPVLVHNLQKHPVSDSVLHVDFRQVDLKQKVQVAIPVELTGESMAVTKGGVLVPVMTVIQIEALPADLPDKFKVDISSIEEIGQGITIKDLKVDREKVKILVEDENQLIVKVEEPKKEEEVKPAVEAVPAEGVEAVPAEGEAATGKVPEAGKVAKAPETKAPTKPVKEEKK